MLRILDCQHTLDIDHAVTVGREPDVPLQPECFLPFDLAFGVDRAEPLFEFSPGISGRPRCELDQLCSVAGEGVMTDDSPEQASVVERQLTVPHLLGDDRWGSQSVRETN